MVYPYPVKHNGEVYPPGTNVPDETKVNKADTESVEKTDSDKPKTTAKRRK